jgi:Zn-dependent peptidase ImmA (M78 family)/transcriptional regulator with XRE-family HTH domain
VRLFQTWDEVGARVAEAREALGITQAHLASAAELDRTALAKIERGSRGISSLELARLATALQRPIDWFVREAPPAVVSRRQALIESSTSITLDALLERTARDVELLLELGGLPDADPRPPGAMRSFGDAENLAREVRGHMGVSDGPLVDLGGAVERLGLHSFVFELNNAADGAYAAVSNLGVTVVNGSMPSGRRRFTLAHELGHHLLSDAYSTDYLDEGAGSLEGLLNAFAAYLLMPRHSVVAFWRNRDGVHDQRTAAIHIAARYRVSWTAACSHLHNLELVDDRTRMLLAADPPRRADYLELGLSFVEELEPPWLAPAYKSAVIRLYRRNKISSDRALELLHGTLVESDLPAPHEVPLDALRPDVSGDQ